MDRLRSPPSLDPRAAAYKDWLHVNVFDCGSQRVSLFNASLHGDPDDPRSVAVGAVVVADLGGELAGEVAVADLADAAVSPTSIGVGNLVEVSLDGDAVDATARLPGSSEVGRIRLVPTAVPVAAEVPAPFGSGWIAWRALPRCSVTGRWPDAASTPGADRLLGYHDHNWGRWHWGDDAGWEWAALLSLDGTAIVLTRTTDRAHRTGRPVLHADVEGVVRRFPAGTVTLRRHGRHRGELLRLPGAMAALHGGRLRPLLPRSITVVADDGIDRLEVEVEAVHACQLVTADPMVPGYGFIHELFGRFGYRGRLHGRAVAGSGLGVFEHVD